MRFREFIKAVIMLTIFISWNTESLAQFNPAAAYRFDNMDLSESTGNYTAGRARSNDFYECGVGQSSFALAMTGNLDTISLDPRVKDIFADDFSLSFYFWADDSVLLPGESVGYTLLSIQDDCRRDSSLNIRYVGVAGGGGSSNSISQLSLEYTADDGESVFFSYDLNRDFCWHHVVFTKSGATYSWYVDGEFLESDRFIDDITLGVNFPVFVGFSECVGIIDEAYNGRIDEIEFFDEAITEEYIVSSLRFPDQIISMDTTLFEGDSYEILTGGSCAPSISWTPVTGLDNPLSSRPTTTPSQSTTYEVQFDHGSCLSTDTVRISIVKEENIDCEKILLPKAFTPNQDNLNDFYGISNKFIVSDLGRFEIYDRWGMKLFDASSKDDLWNGQYNGQNMMPGTYVYKIEYTCLDNIYQKTGSFNLIK